MSWRFVNAAVRGTSHERGDLPCQDDCFADVIATAAGDVLIAICSDGAGSAACAEEGSGLMCETLLPEIERSLRGDGAIAALTRETAEEWIAAARAAIARRAEEKALTPRDFACTLAVAVVAPACAAFLQIGDGAIVAGCDGALEVVFWPDGGEYANTTYFTTDDDWSRHLHFALHDGAVDEIALMTDGLQRLALAFDARAAHRPFFEPMFRALQAAPPGFASALEPPLVAFLGSDAVNARTDDDKSLVLATRRTGAADGTV